ncbi:MAG: GIY-YIG nuclease family protein [bacterium]|nr:GIY-YIG nuclease family protein [Candidatus Kapabacteria bacterium]
MTTRQMAVYIMANARPTLYVGVTNNLIRRVVEHKGNVNKECFTSRYHLHKLVYVETTESPRGAIIREKQIKNMSREEKLALIRSTNPRFEDLFASIAPDVFFTVRRIA